MDIYLEEVRNQRFRVQDHFFQSRDLEKVNSPWYCAGEATDQRTRTEVLRTRTETSGEGCCNKIEPGLETHTHHGDSTGLIVMKVGCDKAYGMEEATYIDLGKQAYI